MPKPLIYIAICLTVLAMIPPALIARKRAVPGEGRPLHLILDMDNQARFRGQMPNDLFADGRAMRLPVEGTVSRGHLNLDDHFNRGVVGGEWATSFPTQTPITMELLERGQDRFDIYCQPCHGIAGYGDGIVHIRAMELLNRGVNGTTWVQPKSLHEQAIREQPVGQIFNSITNGVRNMPPYASQIPVADRWAIVAYVKALQRSQHANPRDYSGNPDDLPVIDLSTPAQEGES